MSSPRIQVAQIACAITIALLTGCSTSSERQPVEIPGVPAPAAGAAEAVTPPVMDCVDLTGTIRGQDMIYSSPVDGSPAAKQLVIICRLASPPEYRDVEASVCMPVNARPPTWAGKGDRISFRIDAELLAALMEVDRGCGRIAINSDQIVVLGPPHPSHEPAQSE